MKRHLAPALFSLSLCAVMGGVCTAGAQTLDAIAPSPVDSTTIAAPAPVALFAPAMPAAQQHAGAPTMMAPTPIVLGRDDVASDETRPVAPVAMVDWKMPTSRALMIGGAATAIIGLAAVGGDTGAIIALSGTAVAVYGLYLHYNR
jgi:hypothetical protein